MFVLALSDITDTPEGRTLGVMIGLLVFVFLMLFIFWGKRSR